MKRVAGLCVVLAFLTFNAAFASAATEVKMTGDARIWGNYWSKGNYTGWNPTGTRTADSFTIWERFRLRSDFIANEGLKFRLGLRVIDTPWGNNGYAVDNSSTSFIEVYQAYLQFKWPNTDIQFTMGLQELALPISSPMLNGNPVLSNTQGAAAVVSIPVAESFQIIAGFSRLLDGGATQPTTTQTADLLDAYFVALPITLEGFQATPWGVFSMAGKQSALATSFTGTNPKAPGMASSIYNNAEPIGLAYGIKTPYNPCWWLGTTMAVTALDPFKFYGDIMYGATNVTELNRNIRKGLFFDVAAEYTGWDVLTPQLTFWYATGEDSSISNGSERLPFVVNEWGASNSFLFDTGQALGGGHMPVNAVGSWGFTVALDKISFMENLTHRLAFTFANGTNDPRALRIANTLYGVGNYVQMGRDLTTQETVFGVNFDNKYNIYENLALVVETGWSHGNFQSSVWGRRFTNAAANGDAWKAAFGLTYKF